MIIRTATMADLKAIAAVEAECFPPAEAATEAEFAERLRYFSRNFWLMFDGSRLVAFVDGFVTDKADLTDDMYSDASQHDPDGAWQMIFGVNTLPAYRRRGCAEQLLRTAIAVSRKEGRRGLVLTCKEKLVRYYEKFGFVNEGLSCSVHGGAVWYRMRLTF